MMEASFTVQTLQGRAFQRGWKVGSNTTKGDQESPGSRGRRS